MYRSSSRDLVRFSDVLNVRRAYGPISRGLRFVLTALCLLMPVVAPCAADWEPTKPIQLIVPVDAGSVADLVARELQAILARSGLLSQPMKVMNRPGEDGAEGFDEARAARGDPHVLILGLSNIFTTPPATGSIGWRDLTPVALLALEPMALWVPAAAPYHGIPDLAAMAHEVRMGAAGAEGEAGGMLVSAIGWTTGAGFTFAPIGSGAEAAQALKARRLDVAIPVRPMPWPYRMLGGSVRFACSGASCGLRPPRGAAASPTAPPPGWR